MESSTLPERVAGGVDQRYFPGSNAAALVQNFRYEPSGGWRNDRGWEPLIPYPSPWNPTLTEIQDLYQPCRFLTVIQRHQGSEEYYLQERNGVLFYEYGNMGIASTNKVVLDTGRNLPRSDDPGTQAVPFGRFVAVLNGYDNMLKFWGRARTTQFGFYQLPPTPTPIEMQTSYNTSVALVPAGSNTNNDLTGVALLFAASSQLGLGSPSPGAVNTYSYRQSYVTDTGSESPLSPPCTINWIVPTGELDRDVGNQRKYGVMLAGLDPGPNGTVARRIYRTKNKKDGISGAGDIFYFVTQLDENNTTTYTDVTPDNQLTVEAPSISDSVTISTTYKCGASWNGAFWLAGGESTPTRIIHSAQGLPEQFPAFNYFDVGVRDGGHITALYPYYDVLLVFRERSIDAVFTNSTGEGYTCTTVKKDCGTTATNTIKLIPGYGIMFMNKDGFWLVKGGMRGGAQIDIISMSETIEKEMGRLSKNALARSCAAYSDREKEYWCMYPVDGGTECTRGASWNTINQQWSFRGADDDQDASHQWDFSQIATDQSGYFILGTRPRYQGLLGLTSRAHPGLGLQVWSGRNGWGDDIAVTISEQGVYTLTPTARAPGQSTWTSTWHDFGDDSVKKRVLSVEVEVITEGNNPIELQWAEDWGYTYSSSGSVPLQVGDSLGSAREQATYSPALAGTVRQANAAVWDTSLWEEPRVTRLRWDVRTGLVSQFQFRIVSAARMQIVKYQINYIGGSVRTPNTRMPGAKQ